MQPGLMPTALLAGVALFPTELALAAPVANLPAELKATTEDGRKVLLTPDGKWRFDLSATQLDTGLPTRSQDSPLQTVVKGISFTFDTHAWRLVPRRDTDEPGRRVLQHKTLPLYGFVIAEEIPVPTRAMRDAILTNVKNITGKPPTVLAEETTEINGKAVGFLRYMASVKDLEVVYSVNYYSDANGNVEVLCGTAQTVFYKYMADCQKFISGLTLN